VVSSQPGCLWVAKLKEKLVLGKLKQDDGKFKARRIQSKYLIKKKKLKA
jgi:hypothetical protein